MHKLLKSLSAALLVASLITLGACSKPDATDAYDHPIHLKDMSGKWIILNYWADWCKPCHQEIPSLNRLAADYPDKVVVLGINFDQLPNDQLRDFIKKNDIHYTILTENLGKRFGIRNVSTLPATFVISPKGVIVKELYGEQTADELVAVMQIG